MGNENVSDNDIFPVTKKRRTYPNKNTFNYTPTRTIKISINKKKEKETTLTRQNGKYSYKNFLTLFIIFFFVYTNYTCSCISGCVDV